MLNSKAKEQKAIQKFKRNEKIGFLAFLGITCAMASTIYEFPVFASVGWAVILYLLICAACFFIPVAIIAAEMGTIHRWEKGGIFVWVSQTLGRRWGFMAIFYQWFAITIAFLGMLFFVSSALGFGFDGVDGFNWLTQGTAKHGDLDGYAPFQLTNLNDGSYDDNYITGLNNTKAHDSIKVGGALVGVMLLVFLTITATQLFGVRYTSIVARCGFVFGIILSSLVLIILGIIYISKNPSSVIVDNIMGKNMPGYKEGEPWAWFTRGNAIMASITTMVAVVLSFIGAEGSGSLAGRLKNVKTYPWAIITLMIVALTLSTFGSMMIAASTRGEISPTGGVIVATVNLFVANGVGVHTAITITRVLAFFMAFGVIAQIASWVIGPAHGLKYAADHKLIPAIFSRTNRYNVPIVNIGVQTCMTTFWILIIVLGLGSAGGSSFRAGLAVTVITYLSCYFLMLTAYVKMILEAPKLKRSFSVKWRWLEFTFATLFFLMLCFVFIVSFINPDGEKHPDTNATWYSILVVLSLFGISLPVVIYELYSRWQKKHNINLDQFRALPLKQQQEEDLKMIDEVKVAVAN